MEPANPPVKAEKPPRAKRQPSTPARDYSTPNRAVRSLQPVSED